jgi:hypothetical protein
MPLALFLLVSFLVFRLPAARGGTPRTVATGPASVAGQLVVADVTVFYEPLAPYGRWFHHARFGYCWIPNGIVAGWRPYTHGYWDYTDDGWVWASYDPWGWGPYHYGRWEFDPGYGWIWIPGTVWGPAWVAWRRGPGYIGWAPLPFEARWEVGIGLVNFDYDRYIEPQWYCFVGERHFGDRYVERVVEVPARNITIIHNTTYITNNYTIINNRVINRGIDREEAQRAIGHSIEMHHIRETTEIGGARARGSDLMIYRPGAQTKGPRTPPGNTETSGGVKYAESDHALLDKQHQKEQQKLADEKAREKAKLEKQHDQELRIAQKQQRKADRGATPTTAQDTSKQERKAEKRASSGQTLEQIKTKQDNEHQAHDQRWTKEKDAMANRHQAESAGRMPPPSSYAPPKPPKSSGGSSGSSGSPKPGKGGKKSSINL